MHITHNKTRISVQLFPEVQTFQQKRNGMTILFLFTLLSLFSSTDASSYSTNKNLITTRKERQTQLQNMVDSNTTIKKTIIAKEKINTTEKAPYNEPPINSQIASNLIDNYYVRDQSVNITDFIRKLEKNGVIAITGIAGAGKTQLAYYYAYKIFREKTPKCFIATILCDTRENLNLTYRAFAIKHLDMPKDVEDLEQIKKYVRTWLQSEQNKNRSFVLIFDNSDKEVAYEIETYFPKNLNPLKQQIIITSQRRSFFLDEEKNFYIDSFTDDEAVGFLLRNSKISFLEKEGAFKLAKKFSNLPLGLQCAKIFLEHNQNISVDEYLKLVDQIAEPLPPVPTHLIKLLTLLKLVDKKSSFYLEDEEKKLMGVYGKYKQGYGTQRAAIALSINQLSPEARYILQCCAFLNADNIPFQSLIYLLSIKFALEDSTAFVKFAAILREYQNYSLVFSAKKTCMSMHRVVQIATRSQMNKKEEKEIIGELFGCFAGQLPEDTSAIYTTPQEKIEIIRALVPHAEKVAKYAIEKDIYVEEAISIVVRVAENYDTLFGNNLLSSQLMESTITILEKHQIDIIEKIKLYIMAGRQNVYLANYIKGKEYLDKAGKELQLRNIKDENHAFLFCNIFNILGGGIYFERGEYDKAVSTIEKALILQEQFPLATTTSIKAKAVISHSFLGGALVGKNELKAAEIHLEKALKQCLETTSYHNSLPFAVIYFFQGILKCYQNKYEEALELFQKSKDIGISIKAKPVDIEEALQFCGWVMFRLGKYNEALAFGKDTLAIFDTKLGGDYHRRISVNILLHCIYDSLGNQSKSIEHLEESIRLIEQHCNKQFYVYIVNQPPPFAWESYVNKLKIPNIKYNLKLLELITKIYGNEHSEAAYYYARVGRSHELSQNYHNALSYYQKALELLKSGYSNTVKYIFVEENIKFLETKIVSLRAST